MTVYSLSLPYRPRVVDALAAAEKDAYDMIEAFGKPRPYLQGQEVEDDWFVEVFGQTEREIEEHCDALAAGFRRIPFWRRRERWEVMRRYIVCVANLTAATGLETVWR